MFWKTIFELKTSHLPQFQVHSLAFKKYNQKYALLYTTVMCMRSPGLCHINIEHKFLNGS